MTAFSTTFSRFSHHARQDQLWSLAPLLGGALLLFAFLEFVVQVGDFANLLSVVTLILVVLPGLVLHAGMLPRQFNYLAWAVNGCCVLYLLGMHATYEIAGLPPLSIVWVPILIGLLAFRWPVLIAFPAVCIRWMKLHNHSMTKLGAPNSADFVIVPDLALLLAILVSIFAVYRYFTRASAAPAARRIAYFNACIVLASGVHLSNYFYSGLGKLTLPNTDALTWVLKNPTFFLAIHSSDAGALTLLNMMPDKDSLLPLAIWSNVPLNVFVLAIQLWALVSLVSIRGTAWLTFLYDVMHVGIFLLTGIFFWKWIVLNAAFIAAFRRMKGDNRPPLSIRLFGCAVVIIAPLSFHIVHLAWLDTGAVNGAHFEVLDPAGNRVQVPSNFFLDKSINVAQQSIVAKRNGFLPTGTWGTVSDGKLMLDLEKDCPAQVRNWSITEPQKVRLDKVVRLHHAMALRLADASGHVPYDFYPHHIWSAPWLFDDFKPLDVRNIKSYFFVVESRCVTIEPDGRVNRSIVGRKEYEIKL